MSCGSSSIEEKSKRDRQRAPCQLKSRAILQFFGVLYRRVSRQLNRYKKERNRGASMLADEREMQLKRNCRERRNHTRESSSLSTAKRGGTGVLQFFAASLAVNNLGFHIDLVWREKSLHCFIFSNPCN